MAKQFIDRAVQLTQKIEKTRLALTNVKSKVSQTMLAELKPSTDGLNMEISMHRAVLLKRQQIEAAAPELRGINIKKEMLKFVSALANVPEEKLDICSGFVQPRSDLSFHEHEVVSAELYLLAKTLDYKSPQLEVKALEDLYDTLASTRHVRKRKMEKFWEGCDKAEVKASKPCIQLAEEARSYVNQFLAEYLSERATNKKSARK